MVKERQEGKYKSEELLCSSFSQISLIQSTRKNYVRRVSFSRTVSQGRKVVQSSFFSKVTVQSMRDSDQSGWAVLFSATLVSN